MYVSKYNDLQSIYKWPKKGRSQTRKLKKHLRLCEYVGDFLLITTQFLFAAQIH